MENRITVTICGMEYTLTGSEDESSVYMQKVASFVSDKMDGVLKSTCVGRGDAAVLTALNLADELFKSQAAAEQLRSQIKNYVEDASRAQSEVSELKREVFRLQQRLQKAAGRSGGK